MTKSVSVDAAIVVPWRAAEGREQSFDLAWRYNNSPNNDVEVLRSVLRGNMVYRSINEVG
jgi:hypothetical protein